MEKQQLWFDELVKIANENPDAKIMHMVSDSANNGDFNFMVCEDVSIELTEYIELNEELVTDEDVIREYVCALIFEENQSIEPKDDEELEKLIEERYERFIEETPWIKAIFINVG